ncbi:hypothetical protein LUPAC06_02955 [Micromonospora saelicesensis]|nr:hypothetical protein LUPAC06_02955 [Micromonospora saelicesensis]
MNKGIDGVCAYKCSQLSRQLLLVVLCEAAAT